MAKLYGWASYMAPFLDHAYVTSSKGHRWPCFGGTNGGRQICSGSGGAEVAHCISHPDSEAGIRYGLTGACHQAANRILWPAGVVVSGTGGYILSVMIYGAYGTPTEEAEREWQELIRRCSAYQDTAVSEGPSLRDGDSHPALTREEQEYVRKLIALHSQAAVRGPVKLLAQEAELLVQYRLPGADSSLIRSVQEIQKGLIAEKALLDKVLLEKHVGGHKYAAEVNSLINQGLEQFLKALGSEYYERLFGLKPAERCDLVVPAIAAESFK